MWGSRGAAHSESTREGLSAPDTWRIRVHPGFSWGLGTRVALGVFRGKYHSLDSRRTRGLPGGSVVNGYSGHVSTRATSGGTLPFVLLGTRGALAGFRGKYHSLDFTVHSGASGRLRRTRRLPGKVLLVGLAVHSGLPGLASGFGTRGQVSCSEGDSKGFRKGFRLASGTRGLLRKVPKEVPSVASKGAFGRASGRLRRGFGTRGTLRRAPKGGGASGWHVPKGSSKGFPRGSSKGSREGLPD